MTFAMSGDCLFWKYHFPFAVVQVTPFRYYADKALSMKIDNTVYFLN